VAVLFNKKHHIDEANTMLDKATGNIMDQLKDEPISPPTPFQNPF